MSLFAKTPTVSTDNAKIAELLTRGVERIYPTLDFLQKRLKNGERLTLYLGIDPTGPLHIGHVIPLLKLRQFQKLGHRAILLIGDFTGMIGDPTDRSAARKRLPREEVLSNAKEYKTQSARLIRFDGENPAKLRYNSEWLGKLSFADGLELCAHMSHAQAIKRDMFQRRISEGKNLFLHELLYPLMQGYDSVVMDVDGEVGGNDQTFNMLAGRDLMKKMKNKEKFVVAVKLIVDPSGKKMGKTEGNLVALSDTPSDCFGKIMSWPDSMIIPGFELCTTVPLAEIEAVRKQLEDGTNPKELKLKLSEAIVTLIHGEAEAKRARAAFEETFSAKGVPEEVVVVKATEHELLIDVFLKSPAPIVASKAEFRRLAAEGAITHLESGEKVKDDTSPATVGTYRIGKHRFLKIER